MEERILVADDEESIRFTFADFLSCSGYQVETADSLSCCIKKMQTGPFDLLFLDIGLGNDDGIEAIKGLKVLQPACKIVIITGAPGSKTIMKARSYGAVDYLAKPVREASLRYIAQKVLARTTAEDQENALPRRLSG